VAEVIEETTTATKLQTMILDASASRKGFASFNGYSWACPTLILGLSEKTGILKAE
jgi:hypothetical protein